jgi:hypothetical protein
MLIGDSVIYDGVVYVVVGFTSTSVLPAQIGLRDPDTSTTFWVERRLVRKLEVPQRAALRVTSPDQPVKGANGEP